MQVQWERFDRLSKIRRFDKLVVVRGVRIGLVVQNTGQQKSDRKPRVLLLPTKQLLFSFGLLGFTDSFKCALHKNSGENRKLSRVH